MGFATAVHFAALLATMLLSKFSSLIAAALSLASPNVLSRAESTASFDGLTDAAYRRLPVGEVKANGWLLDQMKLQNAALGGQLQKFGISPARVFY